MATKTSLKCSGLYSFANQLDLPPGSLQQADNVVINKMNVIEPMRGFKLYGNSFGTASNRSKQLLTYKGRIIRHYLAKLEWDNGSGLFTEFAGNYSETDAGLRIKYIESKGNLYFTTSDGIKKLSVSNVADLASTQITSSGGVKALDGIAELNTTPGFFTQDSAVAYRVLWGIKDVNNNLIYGTPSERIIITNSLLGLLYQDFNNLLIQLDDSAIGSSSDLLSDSDYLSALKADYTTSALQLKGKLENLCSKLDNDFVITEQVSVSSISVTSNIATLVFGSSVEDFLSSGDFVQVSGFTSGAAADMNGFHKITTITGANVTFTINHTDFTTVVDTATVKRLKYTISPYRYVTSLDVPISSESALIKNQYGYIKFASDVTPYVSVGDTITVSGLSGAGIVLLNDTFQITGIQKTDSSNDTIQVQLITSDVAELADTGGSITLNASDLNLFLSDTPSTEQLENLQNFYDTIVSSLLLEPVGILDSTTFNPPISTQSSTVDISFTVPQEITTAHFYQLYRSPLTQSTGVTSVFDLVPSDEMNLVYEANPTLSDIANKTITVNDIVPEDFRNGGTPLYTNPNTGEGIAQANDIPPLAKDIAMYKGYTFYANTQTRQRKTINLLGVANLASQSSHIRIGDASNDFTYTFVNPIAQSVKITTVAGSDYVSSGTSDYFDIYSANDAKKYRVYFKSGTTVAPSSTGVELIEIDISGSETDDDVATEIYNALNLYNDFITTAPSTNEVIVTNSSQGITSSPSENVVNAGFSVSTLIVGDGEDATNFKVEYSTSESLTPSQQVDACARSLVRVINKTATNFIYAFYLSGPDDVPGKILLESRSLSGSRFFVLADNSVTGQQFDPDISPLSISSISMANPTVITSNEHNLVTGQEILIVDSDSTPNVNGKRTVTVTGINTFTVPVNVVVAGTTGLIATEMSDNEVKTNRIYYSKYEQPEAVPILNYFDVGPEDKKILRVLSLRDSLFILKEDGVYRSSGDVAPFSLSPFDYGVQIFVPDSAVVLNNQIYCATSEGIYRITETGAEKISLAIENILIKLGQYPNFPSASFGVGYESDASYLFFTTTNKNDSIANQCYRYNTTTNTWTRLVLSTTCGIVNSNDDKMYLGAGDTNYIEIERKDFARSDYAGRELSKSISTGGAYDNIIKLNSVSDINIGDVVYQEQTVTIYQFNQILKKLDTDPTVADSDYMATLEAESGDSMLAKLLLLAGKLDADSGVFDTDYLSTISGYTSSFEDIQSAFNDITAKLNNDVGVSYNNYPSSTGVVRQETDIIDKNNTTNTIVTRYSYPFITGPITIYKKIDCVVAWAPDFMDDPSVYKQVREGTIIFEYDNFNNAIVGYSSDLSPAFEDIEFNGNGNGIFGGANFGETPFGGLGTSAPFRTLIPRDKQRCRFIKIRFKHGIARESFAINGISLTWETYSTRAYK